MAFRKRNIAISRTSASSDPNSSSSAAVSSPLSQSTVPGTRPSPIDGRLTTSTGTPSFDSILAGHAGLGLGNSILIEESGTTDYAGSLLRFYAAEGVVQGHKVHVVGVGEGWGRELPGLVGAAKEERDEKKSDDAEKMKIAWRYERLGEFGSSRGLPAVNRSPIPIPGPLSPETSSGLPTFCHTFDLAKRLELPIGTTINCIPIPPEERASPFNTIIQHLQHQLISFPRNTIHRLVIPTLLSPALYPQSASNPHHILPFLHALRALLRQHPTQLTAILTLPLSLYPRTSGLVRWMELLSDGVVELTPFAHHMDSLSTSGAATAGEERPQGMLKIHRLPVFHEKGGGGGDRSGLGDDLAFTVSRRKFVIAKFSLPPAEGDKEGQEGVLLGVGEGGKQTKVDLDF